MKNSSFSLTSNSPGSDQPFPEKQVLDKRKQEIEKMYLSHDAEITPILFSLGVLLILYLGWKADLENYMTAESGLGYWLGVAGSVMMMLTLLYSCRKRLKPMRDWGQIRNWYTAHMILGIIGPVLIVFHSNYSLGSSKNEIVAMISMIVVVISGIVGRYLHDKIRYGLYKNEAALDRLQMDRLFTQQQLSDLNEINPDLFKTLIKYSDSIQLDSSGLIRCFFRMFSKHARIITSKPKAKKALKTALQELATSGNWTTQTFQKNFRDADQLLSAHYETIKRIANFSFFERLSSIWYFLHVPLFYMMMVSVIFHIIAVHMFSAHTI